MNTNTVAIVFTYHNRKEKTLRCMERLHQQKGDSNYQLKFFCCDDGTTDGTTEAILSKYPETKVVYGNGNLFWAKGMAVACQAAQECDPDYYLMVNDDVDFSDTMLVQMMSVCHARCQGSIPAAIVGATCDVDGERTYGGIRWNIGKLSVKSVFVNPSDEDLSCNVANWNCFLIPREIYHAVGQIDDYYEHGLADFDYSLRIVKDGYRIYCTNDYVGICEKNPIEGTWKDKSLPFLQRWKLMQKRTAKPWKSDIHFYKKHMGIRWPWFFIKQYVAVALGR